MGITLRFVTLLVALVSSLDVAATSQRTFVASTGSDSNSCSPLAPCRSFATAMAHTNDGGEVIVLDSAGYGPVTIMQSVSIIAPPGVYAGISVFSGDGVTIADPNAVVLLRGVSINGQGGNTGIVVSSASDVHIENATIGNMQLSGIFANAANAAVAIKDTVVRDSGGHGVYVAAGTVTLANVKSDRNLGSGFYIQGGGATISGSTFSENVGNGVRIDGGNVAVRGTTIARNATSGVFVNDSTIALSDCAIDGNAAGGLAVNAASFASAWLSGCQITNNSLLLNGSGVRSESNNTQIILIRTTLMQNFPHDIDAANCCTVSYGDNSWISSTGGNLSVVPHQ